MSEKLISIVSFTFFHLLGNRTATICMWSFLGSALLARVTKNYTEWLSGFRFLQHEMLNHIINPYFWTGAAYISLVVLMFEKTMDYGTNRRTQRLNELQKA